MSSAFFFPSFALASMRRSALDSPLPKSVFCSFGLVLPAKKQEKKAASATVSRSAAVKSVFREDSDDDDDEVGTKLLSSVGFLLALSTRRPGLKKRRGKRRSVYEMKRTERTKAESRQCLRE